MGPAGCFTSQLQMRQICVVLLLCVLPMLGACAAPVYPRYQPMAGDSFGALLLDNDKNVLEGTVPQHGYSDYQIDERTYLVTYQGFNPGGMVLWRYLSHEEWIEMTHDYVLYRAAELARSKGAKQFIILHRDDSNLPWRVRRRVYVRKYLWHIMTEEIMGFNPGAHVLIRLLSNDEALSLRSENHVHEVDRLLTALKKGNARLAAQLETAAPQENVRVSKSRFVRWRAPVMIEDTALEPGLAKLEPGLERRKSSFLYAKIIEDAPGVFKFVQWSRLPLSPIDLLKECIKIADREGYPVFKLEDWGTEEYRPGISWDDRKDWDAWYRTKARIVLQHQSEANSLDPVFIVDEIRQNVMR